MKRATGIMTMVLAGAMQLGSVQVLASEATQNPAYQQLLTQFVTLSQNESPLAYARLVAEPVVQDPSDKTFTDLVALLKPHAHAVLAGDTVLGCALCLDDPCGERFPEDE